MNKLIASKLGIDEGLSFSVGSQIQQLLMHPVSNNVMILLSNLFRYVGEEKFTGSIALQMANTGHKEKEIKNIVQRTILNEMKQQTKSTRFLPGFVFKY